MDKNGILLEAASSENTNQLNLTNNFITFGSNGNFSVSSTGIVSGFEASFDKLTVNGYPVNANTLQCIVAGGDVPPEGHNFLWFKPMVYQALTSRWNGLNEGNNITLNSTTKTISLPLRNKEHFTSSPSKINYSVKFTTYMWDRQSSGQITSIKNAPLTVTLECNGVEIGTATEYISLNINGSATPTFNFSSTVNAFSLQNTDPYSNSELILKVTTNSYYNGQFILFLKDKDIQISASSVGGEISDGITNCEVYYIA